MQLPWLARAQLPELSCKLDASSPPSGCFKMCDKIKTACTWGSYPNRHRDSICGEKWRAFCTASEMFLFLGLYFSSSFCVSSHLGPGSPGMTHRYLNAGP